jgi:hypothetical protein
MAEAIKNKDQSIVCTLNQLEVVLQNISKER